MSLWKALEQKGKFATIIGFIFALPVDIKFIWELFHNTEFTKEYLMAVIVLNIVAMAWFILPSKISIKAKSLEITIED